MVKQVWNLIDIPWRIAILPDEWSRRLGFSSLEDERIKAILPFRRGGLLDIGPGKNHLVKLYNDEATGVDMHDFGSGTMIVEDIRNLPFQDTRFKDEK